VLEGIVVIITIRHNHSRRPAVLVTDPASTPESTKTFVQTQGQIVEARAISLTQQGWRRRPLTADRRWHLKLIDEMPSPISLS